MAAGLGFKTFTTGEVLTAADTNGYLMQGILVFASEAARNSAITSPQEGQFAFTKDTNSTWYYDGAAWVASGASGDVTGVTAGTGITVTDPTGPVPTVTNAMATAITTNGDLIYGTGSGTFTRRAIGSTGNVLTVSGGVPTWAAPAGGGGKVLQVVAATTTTVANNSTNTYADTGLTATITPTSATSKVLVLINQNGCSRSVANTNNAVGLQVLRGATQIALSQNAGQTTTTLRFDGMSIGFSILDAPATTSATTYKTQFKNDVNTANVVVQQFSDTSCMVLLEIGA